MIPRALAALALAALAGCATQVPPAGPLDASVSGALEFKATDRLTLSGTLALPAAAEAIAANTEHAGIILMSTGFRGNEVAAIADGIKTMVDRYPAGLRGAVVYVTRARS